MIDPNILTRFVDDLNDLCPGTLDEKPLKPIGIQYDRRKENFGEIKNVIYQLGNTRMIWYKRKRCAVGVVKMGISLRRLRDEGIADHRNAISMEKYAKIFLDNENFLDTELRRWLNQNGYKDVENWLERNNFARI